MRPPPTMSSITPSAILCGFGALRMGARAVFSPAISELEPAGDLEGHQARSLGQILARHHDIDLLESPRRPEVRHEVGDGGGGEGGAAHLERRGAFLDAGDPE